MCEPVVGLFQLWFVSFLTSVLPLCYLYLQIIVASAGAIVGDLVLLPLFIFLALIVFVNPGARDVVAIEWERIFDVGFGAGVIVAEIRGVLGNVTLMLLLAKTYKTCR